jgi:TolB-like protein
MRFPLLRPVSRPVLRRALRSAGYCGLLVTAFALQGCVAHGVHAYYYGDRLGGSQPVDIIALNERAADALLTSAPLDAQQPLLVATLVSVDRVNESSRLGRMFSEQLAGRLVQRGLRVSEVKLREALALNRDQGELFLSREVREVSQSQNAQAVLVGTYAVSPAVVYVSLKLVIPVGNQVVAAHNYSVPVDDNVRALLAGR